MREAFFHYWVLFLRFVALATLAGSMSLLVRTLRFLRRSVRATGVVRAFETETRLLPGGSDAHGRAALAHRQYARFEFRTAGGTIVNARSRVGEWPTRLSTGDTVPIRYDRDDPQHAEIDEWWRLWGASFALALIGAAALAASFISPGD